MADRVILILAGGRATRMGGGDKPLRLLAGQPILAHVITRMEGPGRRLVLNANGDAGRLAGFGLPVIADAMPDYPGPLAGILAGLDWAAAHSDARHIITVPGDCPFLPQDLVERLEAAVCDETPLSCAASGGRAHPVIGLWPLEHVSTRRAPVDRETMRHSIEQGSDFIKTKRSPGLRADLREALLAGERKIDRFTARFGCAQIEWPVAPHDPFFNINTLDDLEEAEAIAALAEAAPSD